MYDLIKNNSVKVTSKEEKGTAFLYLPFNDLDIVYVCTALHCILGEQFDNSAVKTDVKLLIPEEAKEYRIQEEDEFLWFEEDTEKDIAVFIVNREALESALDLTVNVVDLCYKDVNISDLIIFRGYPNATGGQVGANINARFLFQDKAKNKFELESLTPLDTHINPATDNVPGFSGGGVVLVEGEKHYLMGVIVSFWNTFKRFRGHDVRLITELIKKSPNSSHIPLLNAEDLKKFVNEDTKIEKRLKEKDESLFNTLKSIKENSWKLIMQYGNNFQIYSKHTTQHFFELPGLLSRFLLSPDNIDTLNEHELFILGAASYLHDIGICLSVDELQERNEEPFQEWLTKNSGKEVQDYIYLTHENLTSQFILEKGVADLEIPELYIHAIQKVASAEATYKKLNREYNIAGTRDLANLCYLGGALHLSNLMDIKNYTAKTLFSVILDDRIKCEQSMLEWEASPNQLTHTLQHRDFIGFIGECDDQATYIAITNHIKLLELELKEFHKVMKTISLPQELELDFNYVSVEGFKPKVEWKNIGFSYEHTTLFNSLIGDRLYQGNQLLNSNREAKKISALREAIQNARDACIIRKEREPSYLPQIIVDLTEEGQLMIIDNGIGMDEFIVRNYFARLGASSHLAEGFNDITIGQFGIGVFSYFTITDTFTVKTHKELSEALHFEVPKNPNAFFYFHDNVSDIEVGTSLIFALREEFKRFLNFNALKDAISYYCRYLDLPLTLKYRGGEITDLVQNACVIDDVEAISLRRDLVAPSESGFQVVILKGVIEEGEIGCLIVMRGDTYDFPNLIQNKNHSANFYISLLNNEIKVKEVHGRILHNVFGVLNSDFSNEISLNREEFIDSSRVDALQDTAESRIVEQLLDNWNSTLNEEMRLGCQRKLLNFVNSPVYLGRSLKDRLIQEFLMEIEYSHLVTPSLYLPINQYIIQYPKTLWIIKRERTHPHAINVSALIQSESIPVSYLLRQWDEERFFQYFLTHEDIGLGGKTFIHICNHGAFMGISFDSGDSFIQDSIEHNPVYTFNDNSFWTWLYHYGRSGNQPILNSRHPIVEYYLTNRGDIELNQILYSLFKDFFSHLRTIDLRNAGEYVPELNVKLQLINVELSDITFAPMSNAELPWELRN